MNIKMFRFLWMAIMAFCLIGCDDISPEEDINMDDIFSTESLEQEQQTENEQLNGQLCDMLPCGIVLTGHTEAANVKRSIRIQFRNKKTEDPIDRIQETGCQPEKRKTL